MRRHARDLTHAPIAETLEAAGWLVKNCSQQDHWVDLTVMSPRRRVFLIECKTGKAKLRESQSKLIAKGWPIIVLRSQEDAERFIRVEARTP